MSGVNQEEGDESLRKSVNDSMGPMPSEQPQFTAASTSQTMLLHHLSSNTTHNHLHRQKTYPYLVRPQEVVRWRTIIQLAWLLHALVTVTVLFCGIQSNQDTRKYIPVRSQNASQFFSYPCRAIFVNAFAESEAESGAMVCCPKQQLPQGSQDELVNNLCRRKPRYFPFANRLARFPDAWLLPLFPLILRALWLIRFPTVSEQQHNSAIASSSLPSMIWGLHRTTLLRRLYFYVLLLNIRGWILYLGVNELEDFALGLAARWSPSSAASSPHPCWYQEWFTSAHQQPTPHLTSTSCYGRAFDFSDHVVLYCAQILPIAFTEVLYGWIVPLRWNELIRHTTTTTTTTTTSEVYQRQQIIEWLPLISLLGLAYLYLITCWGMFKTAAYFHTSGEILVGYAISLFIQIPLWGILHWSGTVWSAIRLYLFALP